MKFFDTYREIKTNAVIGGVLIILALILLLFSGRPEKKPEKQPQKPVSATVETTTPAEPEMKKQKKNVRKNVSKKINFKADYPFLIRINRAENFVTVYGIDFDGNYTVAYKTYRCSTGLDPETTPLGTFEISDIYRWRLLVDGSYGQYAMRIHGQIMLHSVPYEQRSPDSLEFWEYNKLGKPASLGCIRLNARNMRWIYRHCPAGTQVEIYSLEHEVPEIPLPKFKKIRATDLYRNWDPTDPNKKNPWKKNKKKQVGIMAKKYYAVKVGLSTGIFETWEECKASVDGYPGALYKSFKNLADAYAYMGWDGQQMSVFDMVGADADAMPVHSTTSDFTPIQNETAPNPNRPFSNSLTAAAYVDGSYNTETGIFGYGVVMFYNGEEFHFKNSFDDKEMASMRNVAGEIYGSMAAMEYAVANNIRNLTIYHDYMGISKWCLGEWKTNKKGTVAYKKYYEQVKKKVHISFEKVKGHSGDQYNDLADALAKEACGID